MMKWMGTGLAALLAMASFGAEDMILYDSSAREIIWYQGTGTGGIGRASLPNLAYPGGRTNMLIVDSLSLLPPASTNKITLASNSIYEINGSVNISTNYLYLSAGTIVRGQNPSADALHYTGTNAMFVSEGGSIQINTLSLYCPSGQVLNVSSTNNDTFLFQHVRMPERIGGIGVVEGFTDTTIDNCRFADMDSGLVLGGTNLGNLVLGRMLYEIEGSSNMTCIAFGTSTWDVVSFVRNVFHFNTNSEIIVLSGLTNSGNFIEEGIGAATLNIMHPEGGLPLDYTNFISGIDIADQQWFFLANAGIPSTTPTATLTLQSTTTVDIVTKAVPVLLTNTVASSLNRFTSISNSVTFTGLTEINIAASVECTLGPATGLNQYPDVHLFLNGASVANSLGPPTSQGETVLLTVLYSGAIENGDTFDVRIANDTQTRDMLVSYMIMRIRR